MTDLSGELKTIWPEWAAGTARRTAAGVKLLIYAEDHLPLIHAKIDEVMSAGIAAGFVKRFASRSPNLLRAVASAIAVAYRQGCQRELRGASPDVAKAFAEIVAESGIDRKAAGLNARSWIAGPHIVSPYLTRRGKLALDIAGPNKCDVRLDGDDLDAVLWEHKGRFVLLDGARWRYFNADGDEIPPEPGTSPEHAVGVCPAVPFVSYDGGDDFWAATAHNGLVDATISIGYKVALGLFARQVAGFPLTSIFAELEKLPAGQVMGHPFLPMLLPTDAKVQVDGERVVRAEDYLEEIGALITLAVSGEGLPPGSVTMKATPGDFGSLTVNAEGPRLAAHRDAQVPPLKKSELSLWPNVCDMLRGSVHRHARILPPGDEVRDMLRASFPDLSSPAEQLARIGVMRAGLPFGLSSPSDLMLAARPEVSRPEVEEDRAANLAEYIADIEPLVHRNIPADAPEARGVQTIAQEQGRAGGEASGQTRAAQSQEPIK